MSVLRGGRSPGSDRDDVFDLRRCNSEGRDGDFAVMVEEGLQPLLLANYRLVGDGGGGDGVSLARSGIRVQLLPRDEAGGEGREKHASHGNYMCVCGEEGQRAWSRDSAQGILGKIQRGPQCRAANRSSNPVRCGCVWGEGKW